MIILYLIISGIISGIIAGMGMGGGTILIPILTIFLKIPQKVAQTINLFAFIPMSICAIIVHSKNKLIAYKIGLSIIFIGTIFSTLGSLVVTRFDNNILRKIYGVFLIIVGIYQLIQTIIKNKKSNQKTSNDYKFKIFLKY